MKVIENPKDSDWNKFWGRGESRQFSQASWSKRRILEVLKPYVLSGQKALDAGCGSGFFSRFFCEHGMQTTAVDYSLKALELAAQIVGDGVKFIKADMLNTPLPEALPDKFDLIFSDGLFEHFTPQDQDRILRNFISVLSPRGVVVTVVPNRWSPWELMRPFFMPGIDEIPFVLPALVDLHRRNGLDVIASGGVNTLPFRLSPEKFLACHFGMLLYTVAKR